jgi:hypothetical protein
MASSGCALALDFSQVKVTNGTICRPPQSREIMPLIGLFSKLDFFTT